MAIPAYLWLKDDGGADIKGSVDVRDREGSIEIVGFGHSLRIPTDENSGKLKGTRIHGTMTFEKIFDSSSPYISNIFLCATKESHGNTVMEMCSLPMHGMKERLHHDRCDS